MITRGAAFARSSLVAVPVHPAAKASAPTITAAKPIVYAERKSRLSTGEPRIP